MQLAHRMQRFGISISTFDATKPGRTGVTDHRQDTIRPRRNRARIHLLEVSDIRIAGHTVAAGIPLVVDSTFTTPELDQTLSVGASIVMHMHRSISTVMVTVMLGLAAGSAA